jgi:hypothetical protein
LKHLFCRITEQDRTAKIARKREGLQESKGWNSKSEAPKERDKAE